MDDGAVVAICSGWFNIRPDERFCAASYDYPGVTDAISDVGCLYDNLKRGYGWINYLGDSKRNDNFLGCSGGMFSDFDIQLSCQFVAS